MLAAPEPVSVQRGRLTIADVVDHSGLIVESKRAAAESVRTLQAAIEAAHALRVTLSEEQARLFGAFEDAMSSHHLAHADYEVAELMRHFPGIAQALFAVTEHLHSIEGRIEPGECCEPEG